MLNQKDEKFVLSCIRKLRQHGTSFTYDIGDLGGFGILCKRNRPATPCAVSNFIVIPYRSYIYKGKKIVSVEIFMDRSSFNVLKRGKLLDTSTRFSIREQGLYFEIPKDEYAKQGWIDSFLQISPRSSIRNKELFFDYLKDSCSLIKDEYREVLAGGMWEIVQKDGIKLIVYPALNEFLLPPRKENIPISDIFNQPQDDTIVSNSIISRMLLDNTNMLAFVWSYILACQYNSILFYIGQPLDKAINIIADPDSKIVELLESLCDCANISSHITDFLEICFTKYDLYSLAKDEKFIRYTDRAVIFDGTKTGDECMNLYKKFMSAFRQKNIPSEDLQIIPIFITSQPSLYSEFINIDLCSLNINDNTLSEFQKECKIFKKNIDTYFFNLTRIKLGSPPSGEQSFDDRLKNELYLFKRLQQRHLKSNISLEIVDFMAHLNIFYSTYNDNCKDISQSLFNKTLLDELISSNPHLLELLPTSSATSTQKIEEDDLRTKALFNEIWKQYTKRKFPDLTGVATKPTDTIGFLMNPKNKYELICLNIDNLFQICDGAKDILEQAYGSTTYRNIFETNNDTDKYAVNMGNGKTNRVYALKTQKLKKILEF